MWLMKKMVFNIKVRDTVSFNSFDWENEQLCTFTHTSACRETDANTSFTLVILGWEQRLFSEEACIHCPLSESSKVRWGLLPLAHSCLREHFLSWTHQPHSNLGLAFRHMPQLARNALHLYKCAAKNIEKKKR